jgi:rare lipoprotein A
MRSGLLVIAVVVALVAASGCATTGASSSSSSHTATAKRHAHKAPSSTPAAVGADQRGDDSGDDDEALAAVAASEGAASWYHDSLAGNATANGEKYDPEGATCAHRTLPFGTILVIEDVASGKKSHCRVNDRGPYVDGRLIDVSKRVARELGMLDRGVIRVRIRVAKQPSS